MKRKFEEKIIKLIKNFNEGGTTHPNINQKYNEEILPSFRKLEPQKGIVTSIDPSVLYCNSYLVGNQKLEVITC